MRRPVQRWRPHPWHGLSVGVDPPSVVNAYVEITPFDGIKYEVDKESGYLRVDRPQSGSALPPAVYGFVPRTFCGWRVAALCPGAELGDGDPLDLCVLSERAIARAEVLLSARVVGGIQLLDRGEADDKIVAVLENDGVWGDVEDIEGVPPVLVRRLEHYFSTYKLGPGGENPVELARIYDAPHALRVVQAAIEDYAQEFDVQEG